MADTIVAAAVDESPGAGAPERHEPVVAAEPANEAADTRYRRHVMQFCGGAGSLVGVQVDQMLRLNPRRSRQVRIGAVDACLNNNKLLSRTRRSPWLREYVLGRSVTNFTAVFGQHEREWERDLPLQFLQSRHGLPGCNLGRSGVDKQPVIAAALNAMERQHVTQWLAFVDASFDSADRSLASADREVSYVAGTGGTGLASAIMHAAWRWQMNPGLIQRLIVLGPELYPITGDPQRDRRHKIIMAAAARIWDRLVLLGTDPDHPHFGGLLPGFSEDVEPGCLGQIILVEGKNDKDQALSFEDAQRMVADYLYYLSQVPELASFLAVELHEDMAKAVPAAMRMPFVWSSIALHVCELWRELPRIAALGKRAAVLGRMREGNPGSEPAALAAPITQAGARRTIEQWEQRVMRSANEGASLAPVFDQIKLREDLIHDPAATGLATVAAIRSIPEFVDAQLPEAEVFRIAGDRITDLRTRVRNALPNMGVLRVLDALVAARVSLDSREGTEQRPVDHFLSADRSAAISAGSAVVDAKSSHAVAEALQPGWFRALFNIPSPAIASARAKADKDLNDAVSSMVQGISTIAGAVLRHMLTAKMAALRGLVCAELDAQIALFTAARDDLAAEVGRARDEVEKALVQGRAEKSAVRLSLFPDDQALAASLVVDEGAVASAFASMFSWDSPDALARTDCPFEDIIGVPDGISVSFEDLFTRHPDARQFIADHLRESEPFIRIDEQGLQELEGPTRRTVLVCPRSLAGFVETLRFSRGEVRVFYADVPAVFVFKQVDTLPSSAIASLCEDDAVLEEAINAEARERRDDTNRSGFTETLTVFPLGRYRHAPRIADEETARWHRRAAAALLLNPGIAEYNPAHPDAAWARLSFVTEKGVRVAILGPDEPMHPECPLFQDARGVWHVRFINHLGGFEERSLRAKKLAYALDLVSRHKRYQAAHESWIERCAKAGGLECGEASNLAVQAFANWCAYAHDVVMNTAEGGAEAVRIRSMFKETIPTADMVCILAAQFFQPDEWFLDFGVTYPNQVMHPARAAAVGGP